MEKEEERKEREQFTTVKGEKEGAMSEIEEEWERIWEKESVRDEVEKALNWDVEQARYVSRFKVQGDVHMGLFKDIFYQYFSWTTSTYFRFPSFPLTSFSLKRDLGGLQRTAIKAVWRLRRDETSSTSGEEKVQLPLLGLRPSLTEWMQWFPRKFIAHFANLGSLFIFSLIIACVAEKDVQEAIYHRRHVQWYEGVFTPKRDLEIFLHLFNNKLEILPRNKKLTHTKTLQKRKVHLTLLSHSHPKKQTKDWRFGIQDYR